MPSDSSKAPDRRRQRAGFSIFVDRVETEGGQPAWQTRLYHAETGVETVQENISPSKWIDWLLERLTELDHEISVSAGEMATSIDVVSVRLVDPIIEEHPGLERGRRSLRAELIVELTGTDRIEQEIGRQVLRQLTADTYPQRKDHHDEHP